MSEIIDTGFDAVIAGEVYVADAPAATPHVCASTTGDRCDVCFGPVTATVTTLTPAGVQAAKALVALPAIDFPSLAKLAREIAMDIKERHAILQEFKLTEAQYEFLEEHNEFYRSALAAACKEWHAPLTTQERIRIEAAAILEDSLLGLGARMQNKVEGLPGVIEAAKLFAKVAGVGERDAGSAAPGERFTINIDLGGDQKITVASGAPPGASVAPPVAGALSTDGKT